ncbi:hypothetical protein KDH_72660 [Dictyobacter sp. S3.2.2.5]|uniref:3'-5' exonuclease domain-containing protein n=1 Tax=Dictyobacter halimunensis TaxID=3026934 RepID=A0ABQ6G590_9CHLR|nr:hypothetical protein KDH_72660 [Dictyobacter sp. S3.2.2.5]
MTTQYVTPISDAFPLWCQSLLQRSDWVILDTETIEFCRPQCRSYRHRGP